MNGKYQFQALAFSLTNILQVELDLTSASNSYSIYIYSRGWFYSHLIGTYRVSQKKTEFCRIEHLQILLADGEKYL